MLRGLLLFVSWATAARAGTGPITIHDVPHDGDCLFSAVALSVALTDGQPAQARATACTRWNPNDSEGTRR